MPASSIERQVMHVLGEDGYAMQGLAAVEAIKIVRSAAFVGAWWERRVIRATAMTVPQFALRLPGQHGSYDAFDYGGRLGLADPTRCPLVSVYVTLRPEVLDERVHAGLCRLASPRLGELRALVEAVLAANRLAVRRGPPPVSEPC